MCYWLKGERVATSKTNKQEKKEKGGESKRGQYELWVGGQKTDCVFRAAKPLADCTFRRGP